MKERPILFSGEMVRALLDGRKTQTRRTVNPQPPCNCSYAINGAESHAICHATGNPSQWVPPTSKSTDHRLPCPYGQPGDRLWVKETTGICGGCGIDQYRADQLNKFCRYCGTPFEKWKPSIFCTRKLSRITLEITAVRVERLQGITDADARAEGCCGVASTQFGLPNYRYVWESINGPGSWAKNPYVWVLTFKKL